MQSPPRMVVDIVTFVGLVDTCTTRAGSTRQAAPHRRSIPPADRRLRPSSPSGPTAVVTLEGPRVTNATDDTPEAHASVSVVNSRLTDALDAGEPVEVVFAVRGKLDRVPGKHPARWRIRTRRGHVVSFRPEFVIGITSPTRTARRTPS